MPFPFVSRAVYDAERARSERLESRIAHLTDELLRMRRDGFTTAAKLPASVPQPVEPEQQALEDAERPVVDRFAAALREQAPHLTERVVEREARRLAAQFGLGA